jgi:hypothetical protein
MPFIIEQIQPPPSVGSDNSSDPMAAYLLLLFLVELVKKGVGMFLLFG